MQGTDAGRKDILLRHSIFHKSKPYRFFQIQKIFFLIFRNKDFCHFLLIKGLTEFLKKLWSYFIAVLTDMGAGCSKNIFGLTAKGSLHFFNCNF